MKSDDKVYHYIGLTPETTMRLRRHILDTFKSSKLLSETIERYIVDGLERDATPEGQQALARMVAELEERRSMVAQKRVLAVRETAARHRRSAKSKHPSESTPRGDDG